MYLMLNSLSAYFLYSFSPGFSSKKPRSFFMNITSFIFLIVE